MFIKKRLKQFDILLLMLLPLLAVILSLSFRVNYLISIILFFGLPAIWLSYRTPHRVKKTALFAFIFSIPMSIVVDSIAVLNKAWTVDAAIGTYRFLGLIPLEDFLWGFLYVYFVVIFYEHFLDKGKHGLVDKKMKYLVLPVICLLGIFMVLLVVNPDLLVLKHSYLWAGMLLVVLPSATFLYSFPKLLSKYVKTACYFFALTFLYELTALHIRLWSFPGSSFIGLVSVAGYVFPIEELLFWIILGSIGVLTYFEFFDDDRK